MTAAKKKPTKAATKPKKKTTTDKKPKAKELSYFEERIFKELGVSDQQNRIKLKFDDLESNTTREVESQIFSEDDNGNIRILPFTIDRELIQYDSQKATPSIRNIENSRRKVFYVTRLKVPEEYTTKTGETRFAKYKFPKGADTQPFMTPGLCEKYERKAKIETLILTEGYFKAFKGYMNGLDIVGLSSISHYKAKETQTMYTDILKVIDVCQVENVVILYDGDARNISLKDLEHKRDLRRRPVGFVNSARNVRELLKDSKVDIYFSAINSEGIKGAPKGLDDLYCALPDDAKEITKDLTSFSRPGVYFYRQNIRFDLGKLYKWFMLDNVENFYAHHQAVIEGHEFIYNGTTYRYNPDKGTCDVMIPGEASAYFRVGDDYYKFVKIPNKYQKDEHKFVRRLKATITEDHGKKLIEYIPKYEAFCNVPDHVNYQQVFNNCFNVYAPFEHEPEEGNCETILEFFKHIFSDQIEIGLDYVQILYQKPTQVLPILCLVSRANKTGKSTFIKLLKAIFTQNATIIGNEELSNSFNAFWATKLIVACEESFIEKKTIIERLKALSTGDKITMNAKGRDQVELDFFAKFILASNNEDTFIFASRDDVRYWVRQIPMFEGKENVNMLRDMIDEIPAFLDFLNKRQMHTQEESRMWFNEKILKTDALDRLIQNSRPGIEKELYEYLKSIYFEFGDEVVYMTPTNANDLFLKRKQDISYLSRIFRDNMGVKPYADSEGKEKVKAYSIPYWGEDEHGNLSRKEHKYKGRPYVFPAEKVLDKIDLKLWLDMQTKEEVTKEPEPSPYKQLTIHEGIEREESGIPADLKDDLPF